MFGYPDETLFLVFYILHETLSLVFDILQQSTKRGHHCMRDLNQITIDTTRAMVEFVITKLVENQCHKEEQNDLFDE